MEWIHSPLCLVQCWEIETINYTFGSCVEMSHNPRREIERDGERESERASERECERE